MFKAIKLIALLALSFNVQADVLKEDAVACESRDLFVQIATAATKQPPDNYAVNYLLENGCLVLNADYPLTVLDDRESIIHARVYDMSGNAFEVWTIRKFVKYGENVGKVSK